MAGVKLTGNFKAGAIGLKAEAVLSNPKLEHARSIINRMKSDVDEPIANEPSSSVVFGTARLPEPRAEQTPEQYFDDTLRVILQQIPSVFIQIGEHEGKKNLKFITRQDHAQLLKDSLFPGLEDAFDKSDRKQWAGVLLEEVKPKVRYAMFSHRWGEKEPLYDDADKNLNNWHQGGDFGPGVKKLMNFCKVASEKGLTLAWSDTCCIRKNDPEELQECITSMFRWYRGSEICLVHMANTSATNLKETTDKWEDKWFTRGWTLQELLAPRRLKFFDQDWTPLTSDENDKEDVNLMSRVAKVTGISHESIKGFEPGANELEQKMTWASRRETTRPEDIAYCLLGIFNVDVYIKYGEGLASAFYRLQEQIIKKTTDRSLFNWYGDASELNTMVASHPRCFDFIRPPILRVAQPMNRPGILKRIAFACTGVICFGYCVGYGVQAAVRLEVLTSTSEVVNDAISHFDITNTGLHLKTDTIRILHKWRLPHKEGCHRWYLSVAGYKRVKVMIKQDMMAEYQAQKNGKDLILIPVSNEVVDIDKEERYPRLALLLFKVDKNVWRRVRTVHPIILERTPGIENAEIAHTIYVK